MGFSLVLVRGLRLKERRNREKKVKRKMKEKAKKAGGDGGGEVEITAGEVVGSGRDIEMGGEGD